jgi:sugar phosphate isomerase/epimerase
MQRLSSRRDFLFRSATAATALCLGGTSLPLHAAEPFKRPGQPRLLLGLAAYSFRDYFTDASHPRPNAAPPEKRITLFDFVDYCAAHGCAGAELTSYYFPPDADKEYLLKLKRHCFLRGVEISGTSVGNTFTHPLGTKRDAEIAMVKKWIDHAQVLGAPHIRVFAGEAGGQPQDVAKKNCISALEECCAYAGARGIFLGIENHGGIVAAADELLDIIQSVKSPWLGINLDSANFHTTDVYGDMAKCAPYAVNVQLKTEIQPRGAKTKEPADLKRIIDILRAANYQGYVTLEYEAAEDPWKAVPGILKTMEPLLA